MWLILFFPLIFPLSGRSFRVSRLNFYFYFLVKKYLSFLDEGVKPKNYCSTDLLFFSLFFFIFILNIFSLVGYIFPSTGHFIVNYILGLFLWRFRTFLGFVKNYQKRTRHFVLKKIPNLFVWFLIFLEVLRSLIRSLVLAIRLTANLLAGHTIISLIFIIKLRGVSAFIGNFVHITLIILETIVSLAQAYIFSLLCQRYLREIKN